MVGELGLPCWGDGEAGTEWQRGAGWDLRRLSGEDGAHEQTRMWAGG